MVSDALKQHVANRGVPPESFLEELIAWGTSAPAEIFARNLYSDIYSSVKNVLGPWQGDGHRRAVLLEVMRVLAGFESSWDWQAGRDTTNPDSATEETAEAGAWQVSADSMHFGTELQELVLREVKSLDGKPFQEAMKSNHLLAMEYIARLLRRTTHHNGPVLRHEIDPWLRRDAVEAFMQLLDPVSLAPRENQVISVNPWARNSDLHLLHPRVRQAVVQVQTSLNGEGIPFKVFEAFRFPQRQADLYAQGRSKPGRIVTYAKPWSSYHQYGMAVDFVLYENKSWSWDDSTAAKKQWWRRLHELGRQYGLMPLDFEVPHLQVAGTSSSALKQGRYPDGSDEIWAEHLAAVIMGWQETPEAPPAPEVARRPAIIG
ncbi:MAG: M15 family metallopeptidase [Desulfobulbus sp.]|nr:M15 family metallopeptidase [Desulfobulbus sp.]